MEILEDPLSLASWAPEQKDGGLPFGRGPKEERLLARTYSRMPGWTNGPHAALMAASTLQRDSINGSLLFLFYPKLAFVTQRFCSVS